MQEKDINHMNHITQNEVLKFYYNVNALYLKIW